MTEPLEIAENWVNEVWQRGNMDFAEQLCAEEYVDYSLPDSPEGDCVGFRDAELRGRRDPLASRNRHVRGRKRAFRRRAKPGAGYADRDVAEHAQHQCRDQKRCHAHEGPRERLAGCRAHERSRTA